MRWPSGFPGPRGVAERVHREGRLLGRFRRAGRRLPATPAASAWAARVTRLVLAVSDRGNAKQHRMRAAIARGLGHARRVALERGDVEGAGLQRVEDEVERAGFGHGRPRLGPCGLPKRARKIASPAASWGSDASVHRSRGVRHRRGLPSSGVAAAAVEERDASGHAPPTARACGARGCACGFRGSHRGPRGLGERLVALVLVRRALAARATARLSLASPRWLVPCVASSRPWSPTTRSGVR